MNGMRTRPSILRRCRWLIGTSSDEIAIWTLVIDKRGHALWEAARVPLRRHQRLRLAALALDHELVESAEIGVGGGHERIRIGPLRGHGLPVLRQPNRNFGLRVGAFGYRMHLVKLQGRVMRHESLDAVEG